MRLALAVLLIFSGQEPTRPNILWITCEDISPNIGCFGDPYAVTPNIDKLATQGVRYMQAFAPIGVCAPSRSTLIMGTYAPSVGTHLMRCQGTLPSYIKCFPEYLRDAGYYCTNNVKTDYNFAPPKSAWDESSAKAHWRNRPKGKPFFAVMNFVSCHESQIRLPEAQYRQRVKDFAPNEIHDPAKAPIPPYHPDTPEVRKDWARYADMITFMDKEVGRTLKELEEDGLTGETIVFYFSDHGAGMPRSKRWLYDSSLRVPMVVRFPEKWKKWAPGEAGSTTDRLISFVDFGPTVLNLAGVKVPDHMQGKPFLGENPAPPREYVYGFRDRMDERVDFLRCIRDKKYKYIRNYMPHLPYAQHIGYMYEMPTMKAWQRLHDEGKLEGPQKIFFQEKAVEELYDVTADPHEVKNLAREPAMTDVLRRMRRALQDWQTEIKDLGFLPEADLRSRFGGKPPHEAVRADPSLYPLEMLFHAADNASNAGPEIQPVLGVFLGESDPAIRYWGVLAHVIQKLPSGEAVFRKALSDPSPNVRLAAADGLCRLGKVEDALPTISKALRDPSEHVRHHAALVADSLGAKAAPLKEDLKAGGEMKTGGENYVMRVVEHALKGIGN
jgi:uncharacterized sulfatase